MQSPLFDNIKASRKPELNVDGGEVVTDSAYTEEDFIILEDRHLLCHKCRKKTESTYQVQRGTFPLPRVICYRCAEIDPEYDASEYAECAPAKPYVPPDVKVLKNPVVWMVYSKEEHNAASLEVLRNPDKAGMVVVMVKRTDRQGVKNE